MPRPETKRSNPSSSVSELAALAKLFEEHRERLLAMARRRIDPALAARVDAEDVLGEAFLRAGPGGRIRHADDVQLYLALWDRARLPDRGLAKDNSAGRSIRREVPWPEQSSV